MRTSGLQGAWATEKNLSQAHSFWRPEPEGKRAKGGGLWRFSWSASSSYAETLGKRMPFSWRTTTVDEERWVHELGLLR